MHLKINPVFQLRKILQFFLYIGGFSKFQKMSFILEGGKNNINEIEKIYQFSISIVLCWTSS